MNTREYKRVEENVLPFELLDAVHTVLRQEMDETQV
jgi:hypothetical protein